MSESNADFQKRLDSETDGDEVRRLVADRKSGLLNDRTLAKIAVAVGDEGAEDRLKEIEETIKGLEAIAASASD